eukprot:CAMPEP_0170167650 /NCGR_PEP_ID=MMETSP0040_2-20121228/997_1 /TAXON_ID=641309 /ORGANISM="Lotharella oceanica, Strain CCMP622" /LENGTH=310 /DNA_ID=CAMNT_0010405743 /DNA_START=514 /DNA_END=1446 /DNA_ORIENTATION=+
MLLQDGFLDGHVAMRSLVEADKFYMARAGSTGKVGEKDIRKYHINNGEPADAADPAEASAERYVHAAIFKSRPDIKCSIHTHAAALKTLSASFMNQQAGAGGGHLQHQPQQHHHHQQQQHISAPPQNHSPTQPAHNGGYPQQMWQATLQMQVEERKRVMSKQVVHQIEFYLGDQNLPYDSYLLNQMQNLAISAIPATPTDSSVKEADEKRPSTLTATGRAWLPIDLVIGFKRMQMILSPLENNKELRRQAVVKALQTSRLLETSKDNLYVRRRYPLPSMMPAQAGGETATATAAATAGGRDAKKPKNEGG